MKTTSVVVEEEGNSKWADAMKNILCMDKPKSKNSLILSRAEKLDPKLEEDSEEDDKRDLSKLIAQANLKKEWMARGRYKPNPSEEAERERKLRRIAIAGVVQLFNAVGKHQRTTASDISSSRTRTSKQFKPLDKKAFLGLLLGKDEVKNEVPEDSVDHSSVNDIKEEEEIKEEPADNNSETTPKWDVLRNDFMMSTKLKDWDKQMDT